MSLGFPLLTTPTQHSYVRSLFLDNFRSFITFFSEKHFNIIIVYCALSSFFFFLIIIFDFFFVMRGYSPVLINAALAFTYLLVLRGCAGLIFIELFCFFVGMTTNTRLTTFLGVVPRLSVGKISTGNRGVATASSRYFCSATAIGYLLLPRLTLKTIPTPIIDGYEKGPHIAFLSISCN
eukprot:gene6306-4538_t